MKKLRFVASVLQKLYEAVPRFLFLLIFLSAAGRVAASDVVAWGAGSIIKPSDNNDFGQSQVPASLTNAVFVAGGWRHSLAVLNNGSFTAWGDDSVFQTNLPAQSNYLALACGDLYSIGLRTNGTLAESGDDFYGEIEVPPNLSNVVAIACGTYHGLALKADGTVVVWSTNSADLGTQDYHQTRVPTGLSNVVAIAGGGWHSLALKSDGTLVAWGRNDYGQGSIPIGISNVVAISAGVAHDLLLRSDGTVFAWGLDTYGQTDVPAGLSNVVAIASGGWHNLALKSDGTIVAWGAGGGTNVNVDYKQNTQPSNLSNVVQIAAGRVHSLALVGAGPPVTQVLVTNFTLATNRFTVSVPTANGRVYRLEYKNFLADTDWIAMPLQAGNGSMLQMNDFDISAPQRFFRVRQW